MKVPKNREVIQLQNNRDPLANEYLQHMDLVYRMCNVNFTKVMAPHDSADLSHAIYIEIKLSYLKTYLYHPLTYLPFLWYRSDNRPIKVILKND